MSAIGGVREYREMGDSWPKATRQVVAFQYQGLGCRLLKVGEAITRAGYKINGEQAIAIEQERAAEITEVFDAGREYQRRLDIKAATV